MNIQNHTYNFNSNPYVVGSQAPAEEISESVSVDTFESNQVVGPIHGSTPAIEASASSEGTNSGAWLRSIQEAVTSPFTETAVGYTASVLCMVGFGVFGGPVGWGILAGLALFAHGCSRMTAEVRAAQNA